MLLSDEQLKKVQMLETEMILEIDRICRKHDIKYSLAYGTMIGVVRHKGFIPWDDDIDIFMLRNDYEKFRNVCENELDKKYFYQTHKSDHEYYYLSDKVRANNTVFMEERVASKNIHHGVYIDVFPVDNLHKYKFISFIQIIIFNLCQKGIMIKYVDLNARKGMGKFVSSLFRIFYAPWSIEKLYHMAQYIMTVNQEKSELVIDFNAGMKKKVIFNRISLEKVIDMEFEGHELLVSYDYDNLLCDYYGDYMKLPPVEQRIPKHTLIDLKL